METDAKGQLGGIEYSDAIRRRMAHESRNWKCPSCAKTNFEILKECEEASSSSSSTSSDPNPKPKPAEPEIPKELNMRWKDEIDRSRREVEQELNDIESAQLAEGFVQTAPVEHVERPRAVPAYPAARPGQGVPTPTATVPVAVAAAAVRPAAGGVQAQAQLVRRQSNAGVPAWVDKAILGVAACLVVMILKILLGL